MLQILSEVLYSGLVLISPQITILKIPMLVHVVLVGIHGQNLN